MEIGWSARKHGIDDEDIEHLMEHAITIENQDDGVEAPSTQLIDTLPNGVVFRESSR